MNFLISYLVSVFYLGVYTILANYFGWVEPKTIESLCTVVWVPVINSIYLFVGMVYYILLGLGIFIHSAGTTFHGWLV